MLKANYKNGVERILQKNPVSFKKNLKPYREFWRIN